MLARNRTTVKITTYVRSETESLDDILSLLQGRVFHVTKRAYLPSILAAGQIRPNADDTLPTSFGSSSNAFFRNRGCVSLFDYRPEPTEEMRFYRSKCWPFMPAQPGDSGIAILMLKPQVHSAIVPYTRWKEEGALSEMVVPYVEAGHPGPISAELIDEVLCLKIEEDPTSLPARLRKALKCRALTAQPHNTDARRALRLSNCRCARRWLRTLGENLWPHKN